MAAPRRPSGVIWAAPGGPCWCLQGGQLLNATVALTKSGAGSASVTRDFRRLGSTDDRSRHRAS